MKGIFAKTMALAFVAASLCANARTVEHKNMIFILVDDQRSDVLGCYGNKLIQTPTINQLAANPEYYAVSKRMIKRLDTYLKDLPEKPVKKTTPRIQE